jgi:hypothetical protein
MLSVWGAYYKVVCIQEFNTYQYFLLFFQKYAKPCQMFNITQEISNLLKINNILMYLFFEYILKWR